MEQIVEPPGQQEILDIVDDGVGKYRDRDHAHSLEDARHLQTPPDSTISLRPNVESHDEAVSPWHASLTPPDSPIGSAKRVSKERSSLPLCDSHDMDHDADSTTSQVRPLIFDVD